ncbi:MAG TPA: oxygenase MpaB family protein [Trebonia sp.]|nr:oxygenase MpaB family protein [Trebonia sp.]
MTAGVFPGTGLFQRAAAAFADCVPVDPADDGLFGPGSVTWRLHADLSAPVSGLRSLLLQALHPLAMAGVDQHSHWRDDPAARFASTSAYVLTTTYGDKAAARAAAERVKKIHEHVRGTDPVTGMPYEASDPALLIWVHAALVDSGLAAADRYGIGLSDADKDRYVAEMTAVAEIIGVPAARFADGGAPASVAELDAYFATVRSELATSQSTADTATYLLGMPDVEPELADVWQVLAAAAVTSLPDWARAMYQFGEGGPAPDSVPPGREEVRQVLGILDAVYLGEPGVLEARQRLTLRMRRAERTRAEQTRAEQAQAEQTR